MADGALRRRARAERGRRRDAHVRSDRVAPDARLARRGRLAASLALALGSLAGAVLLCELVARTISWAPSVYRLDLASEKTAYRLSDDPVLGYELNPGYRDDQPDLNNS